MPLSKCACIETLYTELPFLDRFQAARNDGFDFEEFWSWTDNTLGEGGVVADRCNHLSHTVKLCSLYEGLKGCAAIVEETGVSMNLEALNITTDHPGNFLTSTQMAAELTDLAGSPRLNILYDVYHMQLNEGSLCDHIRSYGHRIGHVHIADAPGRHEPGHRRDSLRRRAGLPGGGGLHGSGRP